MAEPMDVVFLGTGSPLPSEVRCGSGHVVVSGETHILVDCGWGAARRLLPAGVPARSIDVAVFTHMHTDHITDVPDFLFLRWTGGARTPLRVYGPEGTRAMVDGFLHALDRDIGFRLKHHGDKLHPDGIRVEVTEIDSTSQPEAFLETGGITLERFEVDHYPVVPAFGYRARRNGRSVVFSGDTSFCESLALAAEGCDMLICDALNSQMLQDRIVDLRARGWEHNASLLEDVPSYHIHTAQVAKLARDAGVGQVVLSHLIPPIPNEVDREEAFMDGMAAVYGGPIRVARDMQRMTVGAGGN